MIEIRRMKKSDVADMHALHSRAITQVCGAHLDAAIVEAWLHGRTPAGYLTAAEEEGEKFWVAVGEAGRVVGFASWREDELMALFVEPASQGGGIGGLLFNACSDDARAQGRRLRRLDATLNAEGFYSNFGFRRVRVKSHEKRGQRIPFIEMER